MLGGYLMAVDNKKAALEAAMKNIKKKSGAFRKKRAD